MLADGSGNIYVIYRCVNMKERKKNQDKMPTFGNLGEGYNSLFHFLENFL